MNKERIRQTWCFQGRNFGRRYGERVRRFPRRDRGIIGVFDAGTRLYPNYNDCVGDTNGHSTRTRRNRRHYTDLLSEQTPYPRLPGRPGTLCEPLPITSNPISFFISTNLSNGDLALDSTIQRLICFGIHLDYSASDARKVASGV
jgi:hypothetical protein